MNIHQTVGVLEREIQVVWAAAAGVPMEGIENEAGIAPGGIGNGQHPGKGVDEGVGGHFPELPGPQCLEAVGNAVILEYLLELVKRIQAEKVMILSSSALQDEFSKLRAEKFRELCRNIGCHAENIITQTLDPNDNTTLKSLLNENKDAFIFCNNAYLVRDIYIAAMQNGQIPGHDFAIAAIASGVTFTGLIPSLTYVRVPMFELGLQVIRTACAIFQSGMKKKMDMEVVLPELIINESSTITKTKNKVKGVAS